MQAGKGEVASAVGELMEAAGMADVLPLHSQHPKATFQAASQMNCLEFPNQYITACLPSTFRLFV